MRNFLCVSIWDTDQNDREHRGADEKRQCAVMNRRNDVKLAPKRRFHLGTTGDNKIATKRGQLPLPDAKG